MAILKNSSCTSILSFDFETRMIGPDEIVPTAIVCGFCLYDVPQAGVAALFGATMHPDEAGFLHDTLKTALEDPNVLLIAQNAHFDTMVACRAFPDLIPLFFEAYEKGRIDCLILRETLLNLSTIGDIENTITPDGSKTRITYGLDDLAFKYLGVDMGDIKTAEDSWRTNYAMLEGRRFADYPEDAQKYVIEDAAYNVGIYVAQEERIQSQNGYGSCSTSPFQAASAFALAWGTLDGFEIDPVEYENVMAVLKEELHPSKMQKLLASGILRPELPPRPHQTKSNQKLAMQAIGMSEIDFAKSNQIFLPEELEMMRQKGVKLTKAEPSSINTKVLKEWVVEGWKKLGKEPVRNEPTEKDPEGSIVCDADVLDQLAPGDETGTLKEYQHRQDLQKLVTTEMPRMCNSDGTVAKRIHPGYRAMKETSRTSSYADKNFPSGNVQNIDPRARGCYVAEKGWMLLSVDYSAIELVSAAQAQIDMFGRSTLADAINKGIDVHAYLGAHLAYFLDPDFRASCDETGCTAAEEMYQAFASLKKHEDPEVKKFFKHWRTFAKPTGLGYPGGLGAARFIDYARGTYGVEVESEAQARQIKEIWLSAFPEFRLYFRAIENEFVDPDHIGTDDDGNKFDLYAYTSPLGTYRCSCLYTVICNGRALQTPTAEGAKMAVFDVVRQLKDPTRKSILYGSRFVAFIHDQIILEIKEDKDMSLKADALSDTMIRQMKNVFPDVAVRTEATLMRRWSKEATEVRDSNGVLQVWEPKKGD